MMAYVDETDGADRTEALLWTAPTGPLPAPPIDTKAQVLPISDLHWPTPSACSSSCCTRSGRSSTPSSSAFQVRPKPGSMPTPGSRWT